MRKKIFFAIMSLLIMGTMVGCSAGSGTAQASYISVDKAHTIALDAAGVDVESADMMTTKLAERDGIAYYEVDFNADGREYDYSIDAITGVVIEATTANQDISSENTQNSAANDTANTESVNGNAADNGSAAPANSLSAATTSTTATPTEASSAAATPAAATPAAATSTTTEITLDQAKQTALDHAGKAKSEVTFVKEYKDFDDGVWIYEIEFIVQSGNGYQEYDYEISASTGKILSYDYDAESYTMQNPSTATQNPSTATKTEDEVRSIALAKVPGAKAGDCSLWLDHDDGRLIYEGKIVYDLMEYEFEIDAYSGTVLEWDSESIFD